MDLVDCEGGGEGGGGGRRAATALRAEGCDCLARLSLSSPLPLCLALR